MVFTHKFLTMASKCMEFGVESSAGKNTRVDKFYNLAGPGVKGRHKMTVILLILKKYLW